MSMDDKTYAHAKLSVLYIYVNYRVIFLLFIIIKKSNLVLYTCRLTTPLKILWKWLKLSGNCTATNQKRKWVKLLTSFGLRMRHSGPEPVHLQHHTYGKVLP